MASKDPLILADDTPVNIVDEMSLEAGDYVLSVDGERAIRLFEATSAPDSRKGHPVHPWDTWTFSVGDDPIWVWCVSHHGTAIVVSSS